MRAIRYRSLSLLSTGSTPQRRHPAAQRRARPDTALDEGSAAPAASWSPSTSPALPRLRVLALHACRAAGTGRPARPRTPVRAPPRPSEPLRHCGVDAATSSSPRRVLADRSPMRTSRCSCCSRRRPRRGRRAPPPDPQRASAGAATACPIRTSADSVAPAGVESPSSRHRSMKCSCAAERSFNSEERHLAMNSPAVMASPLRCAEPGGRGFLQGDSTPEGALNLWRSGGHDAASVSGSQAEVPALCAGCTGLRAVPCENDCR